LNYPDKLLLQVSKPARYTGGEWNMIHKDWDKTALKISLSYPDIYEIGMSNMAISILYEFSIISLMCWQNVYLLPGWI